ncbi:hypothetical protein [Mesorhizobium sp. NZP2234]|uniref:hypothetical protein n=1 Tax=Mesorhizobium sp. NZP2234 TaxID=2483402 RepID=UPI001556FF79|nr:hypothetical protein [Mesorhizobium sp. NZP2234]
MTVESMFSMKSATARMSGMVRFTSVTVSNFVSDREGAGAGARLSRLDTNVVLICCHFCATATSGGAKSSDNAVVRCNDRLFIRAATCYQPAPILKGKNESALSIPVQRFFRILKGWPWQKSSKRPPAHWR